MGELHAWFPIGGRIAYREPCRALLELMDSDLPLLLLALQWGLRWHGK
jgi:hypothetical protein